MADEQLKELEKLGPKKGVISQSVKDVIQSLVDDDLVFKDKIGTSVCGHFIYFKNRFSFFKHSLRKFGRRQYVCCLFDELQCRLHFCSYAIN